MVIKMISDPKNAKKSLIVKSIAVNNLNSELNTFRSTGIPRQVLEYLDYINCKTSLISVRH